MAKYYLFSYFKNTHDIKLNLTHVLKKKCDICATFKYIFKIYQNLFRKYYFHTFSEIFN